MMDIIRQMDNHVITLKSEKEFLVRQLKRIETRTYSTYSHQGLQNRKIVYCEADTQTESDEELSLCILNESLRNRNKELEEEILTLRGRINHEATQTEGKILTDIACKVLLPKTKSDKYVSSGIAEENCQILQSEYEKLSNDNNELCNKNNNLEKTVFDLQKRISERDTTVTDLEQKLSHLIEQNEIRGKKEEQMKVYSEELKKQIQNKESELSCFKQNMETHLKKLKNELSLEAVNFQKEKLKTKDMGKKVLQLEEQISDLKIMNNKLETVIEINETTATQEKVKLQESIVGQSNDYGKTIYTYV